MIYFPNEPVDIATIAAGDTNIGNVDIASIAAGDNNIGNVDLASSIPAGTNNIGDVDVASIAAGDNNIGNVDIASEIPAGTQTIGSVKVTDGSDVADVVTHTDDDTNIDSTNGIVTAAGLYVRIDGSTFKPLRMDASTHSLQTLTYEHHEIHANSHYFIEDYMDLGAAATADFCLVTDDSDKWVHMTFNFDADGTSTLDFYELADFDIDGTLVIPRANNRAKVYSGQHTPAGSSATVLTDSTASFPVDGLIGWKVYNHTDGSYGIVTDNDATTVTVASLTLGTDNDWDQDDYYEINQSLLLVMSGATVNAVGMRYGGQSGGSATNVNKGIPGGNSRDNEINLRPNTKYLWRFTSSVNDNTISYNAEFYEHTDKD